MRSDNEWPTGSHGTHTPAVRCSARRAAVRASAEHGRLLALALSSPPQQTAADTAQPLAAVGELDFGVRHAEVAPARAPVPSTQPPQLFYAILEALGTNRPTFDCCSNA